MTKFDQKKFGVTHAKGSAYRDNYDSAFGLDADPFMEPIPRMESQRIWIVDEGDDWGGQQINRVFATEAAAKRYAYRCWKPDSEIYSLPLEE